MTFTTLIFDLDGTLAETRQDITDATNHTRLQYNLQPLTLETVSGFVGDGISKLLERALPGFSNPDLDNALTVFKEYYAAHVVDNTYLYPGVAEFLEKNKHLGMAVLSNKAQTFTEEICLKLGISRFFKIVMGSNEHFPRKPAADALLHIMTELQAVPENSVMVGDTKNDILAGQAAGVKSCAVTYGFRSKEELQQYLPDLMIDSIAELQKFI